MSSHVSTGHPEIDRILGGGLTPGSVVLLGGAARAGKTSVGISIFDGVAQTTPALFVSTDLDAYGLKKRLGDSHADGRWGLAVHETSTEKILALCVARALLVVDQWAGEETDLDTIRHFCNETWTCGILLLRTGRGGAPAPLVHSADTVLHVAAVPVGERVVHALQVDKHRYGKNGLISWLEIDDFGAVLASNRHVR